MKTQKFKLVLAIAAIAFTSLVSSCRKEKKDEPEEKDSDTAAAVDQSFASSTVNDMTSIADEAGKGNSSTTSSFKTSESNEILGPCSTVTFDTLAAAKTVTVNFGTVNCLCLDGRYRRGSIILSFTGKYRDSSTVITVTPQNYFVNDNQVTGSKTITNKGHNAANHLVYEISANIQIIKAANGGTISWQSTRQREWTAGESTLNWSDDMYSITGSASGTTSNGNSFTSAITSSKPLVRNMTVNCRKHFVSGEIVHTPSGKAPRTIDFGNGVCDDQATVTINGVVYTITLK